MIDIVLKVYSLLSKKDKVFLAYLVVFSIFISIMETIGVSAIMPFMSVSIDFDVIHNNQYYSYVYDFFSFESDVNFVIGFGITLICFYLFRSAINLLYIYFLARFSQGRYYVLAYSLFDNYMRMAYKNFVKRNTSTLTKSIINEASILTGLISSLLFMMSEIFILIFIYAMILYVNYKITLVLTLVLFLNGLLMTQTISKKIKKIGTKRADIQKIFFEIINKSLSNFKLIKLNSNDSLLINEFKKSTYSYAQINILNNTLQNFPRLFLEAIGFSIIVGTITFLVWKYEGDVNQSLSMISMFVLALYRLLPSVNRIMTSYNSIQYTHKALDIVYNDLMYPCEDLGEKNIVFDKCICVKELSFGYEENKLVLNNVSLDIKKGDKIAFIGESGSGKSTLVDIIIGLYKPKVGNILIDNLPLCDDNIKSWRKKVGYIPQSVYLFDATVGENITFGLEYDEKKLISVLEKAKIYDFLLEKNGLNTLVGEGGVMLSGGQKQRIAIARALYGSPEILVLDEATSALDTKIEAEIMKEIYEISENKTLIIIAHRLSTIKECNKVFKLVNGKINKIVDFGEDIK